MPVIAKADTLTKKEITRLKKRILEEIAKHNIKIYQLPDVEEDEEEDYKEQTRVLKVFLSRENHIKTFHAANLYFFVIGIYTICCCRLITANRGERKESSRSTLPLGCRRARK